jgi:Potential Queuosine, Q, salvage protein family
MSTITNPVRESANFVMQNAQFVHINYDKADEIALSWKARNIGRPGWNAGMHIESNDEKLNLDYMIFVDALNFCSWPKEGDKWGFVYKGEKHTGYFGLALAAKQFFEEKKPDYSYLAHISMQEFSEIFQGAKNFQLMQERRAIINNVYGVLLEKYNNDSRIFFANGQKQMSRLVPQIAAELYGFDDTALYNGRKVFIWKRAQILASDVYRLFNNRDIGAFTDPEYLTIFADNLLPQYFDYLNVTEYTPELKARIEGRTMIAPGSPEEIEMRCASIAIGEYLQKYLQKLGIDLYVYEVDDYLWNDAKQAPITTTRHLTLTTNY